jgi:hypothetical protein
LESMKKSVAEVKKRGQNNWRSKSGALMEEWSLISGSSTVTVHGTLGSVNAPRSFVCIAQRWPSQLITLLSLNLTVAAAFFPQKYHAYLQPLKSTVPFYDPRDTSKYLPSGCIYLLSGDPVFLRRFLPRPVDMEWSIFHLELNFRQLRGCPKAIHAQLVKRDWTSFGST